MSNTMELGEGALLTCSFFLHANIESFEYTDNFTSDRDELSLNFNWTSLPKNEKSTNENEFNENSSIRILHD
jgi:hypothetical protein